MPLLIIPIVILMAGVALTVVFALGFALLRVLFWPFVIGLFIFWLMRRTKPTRPVRRDDWQDHLHNRKQAQNVTESHSNHHSDDWSDF